MNHQKGKIGALFGVLLVTFIWGAINNFIPEDATFSNGLNILTVYMVIYTAIAEVILLRWFILDAKEQDYPLPKLAYVLFFLMTLIMIPIYFLETRKKQAWRPILLSVLFLFGMGVANKVGQYSAESGTLLREKVTVER